MSRSLNKECQSQRSKRNSFQQSTPRSRHGSAADGYWKVLVLNTGGTIAMKVDRNGEYVPLSCDTFVPELRKLPMFHDSHSGLTLSDSSLVLLSDDKIAPIVYSVIEYDPLLDSCNITMDDWKKIAEDIRDNYSQYDGFVILHGTDTMAYTASALSFMLENLGKPVIITGAQIPMFQRRSDGIDNFLGSLILAGSKKIPEVCIYFNFTLFRGCRSVKQDSERFDAFDSPNEEPLAKVGVGISIRWKEILPLPLYPNEFCIFSDICSDVAVLRLFPSISLSIVRSFLQEPIKGVVLQTYGAGNCPSARKDILEELRRATDRGVLIVNITQCNRGGVSESYETGAALQRAGLISGADMTTEAALTKLAYVIGKCESLQKKKELMEQNLRGELRSSHKDHDSQSSSYLTTKLLEVIENSSQEDRPHVEKGLLPSLLCEAAQNGDEACLRKVIDMDVDAISKSNYDGRTPLHIAACAGKKETVDLLLKHGASVNVRDRWGSTPLMNAVDLYHKDVIRSLVGGGDRVSGPPSEIGSKLYVAAADGDRELLECYQEAGVDFNSQNRYGRTALHAAALSGHMDLVEMLLNIANVDPSIADNDGKKPADLAEKMGRSDIFAAFKQKCT